MGVFLNFSLRPPVKWVISLPGRLIASDTPTTPRLTWSSRMLWILFCHSSMLWTSTERYAHFPANLLDGRAFRLRLLDRVPDRSTRKLTSCWNFGKASDVRDAGPGPAAPRT